MTINIFKMDNNKKNEQVENEKFVLVMEEFNQEQQAFNKTVNDLVAQVNSLSDKIEAIKKDLDKPKPMSVNVDTKPFEKIAKQGFADIRRSIPDIIPMRHHHIFDRWAKGFIISIASLSLFTAVSIGGCMSLWSENKLLHANDLKFRMIHFAYPSISVWADSIYYHDPDGAELAIEKAEARLLETVPPKNERYKKEQGKKKHSRQK